MPPNVRALILLLLLIAASLFLPVTPRLESFLVRHAQEKPGPQILFVGNSFTFLHDVPGLVARASELGTAPVRTEMIAYGGKSLDWHFANEDTLKTIHSRRWDYVVLQDCSRCPLEYRDGFVRGVKEMVELVRTSGATPILFMTWAGKDEPANQQIITDAYLNLGKQLSVTVAPVGIAWQKAQQSKTGLPLFESDNYHASADGALLSALVILRTITRAPLADAVVALPAKPQLLYELVKSRPIIEKDAALYRSIAEDVTSGSDSSRL